MNHESNRGSRIFPRERNNHGPAENKPSAPVVTTRTETRLSKFVPNGNGHDTKTAGQAEATPSRSTGLYGEVIHGTDFTPLVKLPLTPVFETRHGGRRVGGGGTSPEALRRAKNHIKKLK